MDFASGVMKAQEHSYNYSDGFVVGADKKPTWENGNNVLPVA
jgi:hypothetical protein